MINKFNASETLHALTSQVELEFLEALLEPDDATYPWNPADEESEAYFLQLEQQFLAEDVLEEDLTQHSQTFYTQLDQLWSNHKKASLVPSRTAVISMLQESLQSRFSSSIPKNWLNLIVNKAAEVFNSKQSTSEQLIECVQSVLPAWGAEDLLVLARPFAYAMRSSSKPQNLETVLNNDNNRDWTNLSEIEQAKASLAIAYYTLSELKSFQNEE